MRRTFSKLGRPAMRKLDIGDELTEHGVAFERPAIGDGLFTVNIIVGGQRIHRVIGRESEGTTRTLHTNYTKLQRCPRWSNVRSTVRL